MLDKLLNFVLHQTWKQVSTNGGNCTPPKGETNKNNNFNTETTTENKKNIKKMDY
jgi:hypothetical protein